MIAGGTRTRLKDIAREANCSVAVVSTVLNGAKGNTGVSAETRERVLSLAKALNYQVQFAGRSLVTRKSHTLGVFIVEPTPNGGISNLYEGRIIKGIEEACQAMGYDLTLMSMTTPAERKSAIAKVAQGRVDGLILLRPWARKPWVDEVVAITDRVVAVDLHERMDGGFSICADYSLGLDAVVRHLIELGHRRFGYIGQRPWAPDPRSMLRQHALERAAAKVGLTIDPRWIYDPIIDLDKPEMRSGRTWTQGYRGAAHLLALGNDRPTAWFTFQDLTATGALAQLYEQNVRVPDQISVIGWENSQLAEVSVPGMTSIYHPLMEMGRRAVEILVTEPGKLVDTSPVQVLPSRVEWRDSIGPVRV